MSDSTVEDVEELSAGRASYLIGGRRVRVSDLVDAGLLAAGTQLTFPRRRSGQEYTGFVTVDGKIELPNGRRFPAPVIVLTSDRDDWSRLCDERVIIRGV